MNINGMSQFTAYLNTAANKKNTSAKTSDDTKVDFKEAVARTAADSIQISSRVSMSDEAFTKALGNDIANEVKAGSSAADVNDLKQQVALGQYEINVADVAKKILG